MLEEIVKQLDECYEITKNKYNCNLTNFREKHINLYVSNIPSENDEKVVYQLYVKYSREKYAVSFNKYLYEVSWDETEDSGYRAKMAIYDLSLRDVYDVLPKAYQNFFVFNFDLFR